MHRLTGGGQPAQKIAKCRRIEHPMLRPVAYRRRLADPPMIEFLETIS